MAQILAVIIFLAMFILIITEIWERHIVTLGCALLTLVLVFGLCMHSPSAIIETLNILAHRRGSKRSFRRNQLGDYRVHRWYDDHGRRYGKIRIFPLVMHEDRETGKIPDHPDLYHIYAPVLCTGNVY